LSFKCNLQRYATGKIDWGQLAGMVFAGVMSVMLVGVGLTMAKAWETAQNIRGACENFKVEDCKATFTSDIDYVKDLIKAKWRSSEAGAAGCAT
jgi:hypothetical protein